MSHRDFLDLCARDFSQALHYNKLWRGDLIPLRPLRKNIFCLTDQVYDNAKLRADLSNVQENTKTAWEKKGIGGLEHVWTSITLKGYKGNIQP